MMFEKLKSHEKWAKYERVKLSEKPVCRKVYTCHFLQIFVNGVISRELKVFVLNGN